MEVKKELGEIIEGGFTKYKPWNRDGSQRMSHQFCSLWLFMLLSLSGEDIIKCLIVLCSVDRPVI